MQRTVSTRLALAACLATMASVHANKPRPIRADSSGEVKFTGVAVEYVQSPVPGGASGWTVTVGEVISGPARAGQVLVGMQAFPPMGYKDPTIEEGDDVEAFGFLNPHGSDPTFVSLNGEDYYIAKTSGEVKFTGLAVAYVHDPTPGSASGWTVEVGDVIFGPRVEGQILVGMQGFPPMGHEDPTIEVGDDVGAFGFRDPYGSDPAYVSLNGEDYYIVRVRKIRLPLILRN
jgi:hypothetical protein